MHIAARRYTAAGAALAVAGVVAIAPIPPRPAAIPVVYESTRLAAAQSLLNIPFNLFQDLVNIPNNEIKAMTVLGNSLIYSGTWFTASATNIWGEDPGDPAHFMGLIDMLVPIKEISGLGDPTPGYGTFSWADAAAGHLGLGQQLTLLANAEIPVSASSSADWSAPTYPTTPITGLTPVDGTIWSIAMALGIQQFPLLQNWFQVPLSDLMDADGYTFGDAINPSDGVGTDGAVPGDNIFGIPGTTAGVDADGNPVNLMPWSNQTFKLDLLWPLVNWWNSLQAAPDMNGFELPSAEEFGRALQTLAAGAFIAFYPLVPGSPACSGQCDVDAHLTLQSMVQGISNLWPGNTSVEHWLDLANQEGPGPFGMANGPTWHQVAFARAWRDDPLQQWFDFGNPSPTDPPTSVDTPISFPISKPMQNLIDFAKASGLQDFFQSLADLAGYAPIDPDSLPGENSGPGTLAAPTPEKDNALTTLAAAAPEADKTVSSESSAKGPSTTRKTDKAATLETDQAAALSEPGAAAAAPTVEETQPVGEGDVQESVDVVPQAQNELDRAGTRIGARDLMKKGNKAAPGETTTHPKPAGGTQGKLGQLGSALKKGLTGKSGKAGKSAANESAGNGRGSSAKDAA